MNKPFKAKLKKNDSYFLELALREAEKAEKMDEVPVGAVLVIDDKIISRAHNKREKKQSVLSHAELEVILKASKKFSSWRLENTTLYVTLEPCAMCAGAIQQSRIKRVVFGAYEKKFGTLSTGLNIHNNPAMNHKFKIDYLENKRCSEILSNFFKRKRK